MIGKNYFSKNLQLLSDKGKFISIAFLSGNEVKLDLSLSFKEKNSYYWINFKAKNNF